MTAVCEDEGVEIALLEGHHPTVWNKQHHLYPTVPSQAPCLPVTTLKFVLCMAPWVSAPQRRPHQRACPPPTSRTSPPPPQYPGWAIHPAVH